MPNDNSQNQEEPSPAAQPVFGALTTQFSPNLTPITSTKKSKKTLFTVLGAIGVVLLIAGGTIAFLLLNNKKTEEPVVKSDSTVLPALGDALKATAKDQSTTSVTLDNTSPLPDLLMNIGAAVWTRPDDGANQLIYYSNQESATDNEVDYASVIKYLTSNNFTEATTEDNAVTDRYFISDTTVCTVKKGQDPAVVVVSNAVNVSCALKADFAKNEAKFKPFVSLYEANPIEGAADVIFRSVVVQASPVKDYSNANLTIAKASTPAKFVVAKFYQTPDHSWHYLATADNEDAVACSMFSTDQLKSAFLGTPCWDSTTSTSSFVQFPINTP